MHLRKTFKRLPINLECIYSESVEAFNGHLLILCAMGLRSLIEGICVDKQVGGRTLQVKIDALATLLPKNIVENLHAFRFMGNEATHELESPSYQQLQLALEICDDLLNYLYDLDYKTGELANPGRDQ